MIRRQAGDDFLLITQTDHAQLAGELAVRFGNNRFTSPPPHSPVLLAIQQHDAGWPLHDDEPTLNDRQLPADVFETPKSIALNVWAASADRAEALDAYAGLLVSLHSLSLSIHAAPEPVTKTLAKGGAFDVRMMQDQFALNKFQHREVERQEQLRGKLGLSMEVPLKHGLAEPKSTPADDQLRFDFRLLQALDLISLCACCSKLPQTESQEVLPLVGQDPIRFKLAKNLAGAVRVSPWPFDDKRFEMQVPCRRVPGWRMETNEQLRTFYHQSKPETLIVRFEK